MTEQSAQSDPYTDGPGIERLPLASTSTAGIAALTEGAQQLGVPLTERQISLFVAYRAEMLEWNRRVNLTAIVDPTAVMTRHFLDSLTVAGALPAAELVQRQRVIDVGSGAGLPGMALAIAFPHWQFTLLESVGKKTAFLRHVIGVLGLQDQVEVQTGRAEVVAHDPVYRGAFDMAVARAVAHLATLAEYLLPFCRVGGQIIALKKGDLAAEVGSAASAVTLLGGEPWVTLRVPPLADLGSDRVLLVSTKRRPTPAHYPRRPGLPGQAPLDASSTQAHDAGAAKQAQRS